MGTPSQVNSRALASIDLGLADRLTNDARFREKYLRRFSSSEVAAELRAMRLRRKLRQAELAAEAKTGQSAISRIEKEDYDGWTYKTLLAIALVLKARLRIHLEPLEDVIAEYRAFETQDHDTVGDIQPGGDTGAAALLKGSDTPGALIQEAERTAPQEWLN